MKLAGGILSVAFALATAQGVAQTATAGTAPTKGGPVYRATYTLTETDAGKKIGVQHYSLVVTEGGRTTMKNGSKVPVATGSYTTSGNSAQTQFTYLDVGINIDTRVGAPVDGMFPVMSKVEQSSAAEDKLISGVNEPIVRQSVLEATTSLTLGKPQMVGTLDFPSSTRHLDVEVVLEIVK